MRPIERVRLIDVIAISLQSQMTYSQIETFLPAFGIDCRGYEPSTNSKRVYVQEVLAYEKDNIILEIAKDLELEFDNKTNKNELATFWTQGHFKLFISHLAKHKQKATALQNALKLYGISGFVAHVDIEPSKEWQDEIEKALHTMDALTAILMNGFKESHWCDQEIGFAVGKDVLIIPIKKEIQPYGFIGKYQAIQGNKKTVGHVAKEIFDAVVRNSKTRNNILTIYTSLISNSTHLETVTKQLIILENIDNIPKEILEQMIEQVRNNTVLMNEESFLKKLQNFLNKYELHIINNTVFSEVINENEIPF